MTSIDLCPSQTENGGCFPPIDIPSNENQIEQTLDINNANPGSASVYEGLSSSSLLSSSSSQLSPRSATHPDSSATSSLSNSCSSNASALRSSAVDKHILRMQQAQQRKNLSGLASNVNASSVTTTAPVSSGSVDSVRAKCPEFATPTKPKLNLYAQTNNAQPPPFNQPPLLTPRSLHTIAKQPNLSCFKVPKSAAKNSSNIAHQAMAPPPRTLFNTNPSPAKSLFASGCSQPPQRCMSACKTSRPATAISSRAVNVHERATPTLSRNTASYYANTAAPPSSILNHDISQLQNSSSSSMYSSSSEFFSSSDALPLVPVDEFSLDSQSVEELNENLREAPEWARFGGSSDIHLAHRLSLSNVTATQSFNIEERRQSLTPGAINTPRKVPSKLKEITSNGKRKVTASGAKRILRTNYPSAIKADKPTDKAAVLTTVANGPMPVK